MNTSAAELQSIPKPPPGVLAEGMNKASASYQHLCLAWHVLTRNPDPSLWRDFKAKKQPAFLASLMPHWHRCRAWLWLHEMQGHEIRISLQQLPIVDREPMRQALNELKAIIIKNTRNIRSKNTGVIT